MCSMWIDGLDAIAPHVQQRANFCVASRAPVEKLQAWAKRRGWRRARLLSDAASDFARDTGAEDRNGDPGATIGIRTTTTSNRLRKARRFVPVRVEVGL
jgi:predicted dithiol-disulfide oxidoreductase (DUF899 family)